MSWDLFVGLPIILLLSMMAEAAFPAAAFADNIPASWRKTMTDDPATNFYLRKFSRSLKTPDAETVRNLTLAKELANGCFGAKTNKQVEKTYRRQSGFDLFTPDAFQSASAIAMPEFSYFDTRALVHLCAGSRYLFGKKGRLIAGLITADTTKTKWPANQIRSFVVVVPLAAPIAKVPPLWPYDPTRPYILVPRLQR